MRKLLLIVCSVLCLSAVVAGTWWGSRALLADRSDSAMSSCTGKKFSCYYQYVRQRTLRDGPTAALADIKRAYQTDAYVKTQCHELVHVVGAAATEKFSRLQDVLRYDDPMCQNGYRHGAEEAMAQQHKGS